MIDHDRDHPLEAEEEPDLDGDQNHRERDADERNDKPAGLVQQVPFRQGENHGPRNTDYRRRRHGRRHRFPSHRAEHSWRPSDKQRTGRGQYCNLYQR